MIDTFKCGSPVGVLKPLNEYIVFYYANMDTKV